MAGAAAAEGIEHTHLVERSTTSPVLAQIPLTARLQMLALRLAREGAHDPDTVITGAWAAQDALEHGHPDGLTLSAHPMRRSRRTNARTAASSRSPTRACTIVPDSSRLVPTTSASRYSRAVTSSLP